ncbi:dicarboxylate/amino acid:cation symporter [Albibacterium bauzanense]|uniref:Na+/H+-dicarboxylate symporter n=1 Tax=Albibacterium bauzanense TaxID=653929 RepID=A0A4R1LYW6_9SPHI|nr:dicarboxylate/amino acid:cation symporter [Albibacterium bauzanense]TCK84748.1 Na+/H+-dicarboxylate symporter [Albibacterium bauzanense]
MRNIKIGLLGKVILAIVFGIVAGLIFPDWISRIFITFNSLFSNFLGFIVPLIILGLIAPGIADLGKSAGKLLIITSVLAYGFTIFTGFFAYFSCNIFYPSLLGSINTIPKVDDAAKTLEAYFTLGMPPLLDVMSALILSFILGLGMAFIKGETLKKSMVEFKDIIMDVINHIIIPILPIYIFGIFLNITVSGQVESILSVFIKIILLIFILTVILLLIQFSIAGIVAKVNPLKALRNMMTAYLTALGTQSSAATIPVTYQQTLKNGVDEDVASFVIPLCATIHLSGSMLKITACAMAIMMMNGMPIVPEVFIGFIFMLAITMVAAPGVPGGAIMAALGVLSSILGFNEEALGLMIALYIAMDSFGTACNVTGDGAIALIINKIYKKEANKPIEAYSE